MQSAAASRAPKPDPSAPRSAMSATPTTQNEGGCKIVPRLPRKMPRRHARPNQTQARHPVPSVPRLPRKTMVDVSLCHACHTNEGGCKVVLRLPRKMPRRHARPNQTQARHGVQRETKVDVRLCHACHVKCRGVTRAQTRPKRATQCHKCHACHAKRPWM